MALTPEDVVNKRFQATKFREGYDQDEVDDFLDEVVTELRRLTEENEDLRAKLGTCERRVGELSRATVAPAAPVEPEAPKLVAPAPAPMVEPVRPAAALEAMGQGPEAAAGMLVLAQKLHDEYVRNGEQQRDRIVNEAREHANRLVREAEDKQRQTLGSLEQERSLLERKIDELRGFEREYRSRLKSYLESQLRDLESKAAVVPNRGGAAASTTGTGSAAVPSYPPAMAGRTSGYTEGEGGSPAYPSYGERS